MKLPNLVLVLFGLLVLGLSTGTHAQSTLSLAPTTGVVAKPYLPVTAISAGVPITYVGPITQGAVSSSVSSASSATTAATATTSGSLNATVPQSSSATALTSTATPAALSPSTGAQAGARTSVNLF